MAVWDAPDERADELGRRLAAYPFVTLCYRRRRRPPSWPYNLFCMVHGKERGVVRAQIARLIEENQLGELPHEVLFSGKRYKQCGARFVGRHEAEAGRRAG